MPSPDVLVVGGGVVGTATAYLLARDGARVTVVDAGLVGQATAAAVGVISPGTVALGEADVRPEVLELAYQGGGFYARLAAWLAEDGQADFGYAEVGCLIVAQEPASAATLPDLVRALEERRAAGVPLIGTVDLLEAAAAREWFPPLAVDVEGAVLLTDAARVDGRRLLAALRSAATLRGVTFRQGACAVTPDGALTIDGTPTPYDALALCTGAWGWGRSAAPVAQRPVGPLRGQSVVLTLETPDTGRWPTVRGFTHTTNLAPFAGGRLVVGATREPGAAFDARVTADGVREVLDGVLSIAPGLDVATVAELRVGLRPVTPDGLPIVGPVPIADHVYACTGHGPYGLLMGPRSAAAVADLIAGRDPGIDLGHFAADRPLIS
ncbi:MAG: FAD-dependent oxidoreductase [Chloroflexi bacterium]|nr:FAD-dependent oxidoreductase [Chloroflexota bacterium]